MSSTVRYETVFTAILPRLTPMSQKCIKTSPKTHFGGLSPILKFLHLGINESMSAILYLLILGTPADEGSNSVEADQTRIEQLIVSEPDADMEIQNLFESMKPIHPNDRWVASPIGPQLPSR
jgi:hypothetical protein